MSTVYANMHLFASCFVAVAQRKIQVAHAACLLLLGWKSARESISGIVPSIVALRPAS